MVILQTKILTFRGSITLFYWMMGMLTPTNSPIHAACVDLIGDDLQNYSLSFSGILCDRSWHFCFCFACTPSDAAPRRISQQQAYEMPPPWRWDPPSLCGHHQRMLDARQWTELQTFACWNSWWSKLTFLLLFCRCTLARGSWQSTRRRNILPGDGHAFPTVMPRALMPGSSRWMPGRPLWMPMPGNARWMPKPGSAG